MEPEKNEQESGKLNSEQLGNVSGGVMTPPGLRTCKKCRKPISKSEELFEGGYCQACREAMQNG